MKCNTPSVVADLGSVGFDSAVFAGLDLVWVVVAVVVDLAVLAVDLVVVDVAADCSAVDFVD